MGLSAPRSQGPRKPITSQLRKPFSFRKRTFAPRLQLLRAHAPSVRRHILHAELNVLLFTGKAETEWKSLRELVTPCPVINGDTKVQGWGTWQSGESPAPRPCCDVTGQWYTRTPADLRGAGVMLGSWLTAKTVIHLGKECAWVEHTQPRIYNMNMKNESGRFLNSDRDTPATKHFPTLSCVSARPCEVGQAQHPHLQVRGGRPREGRPLSQEHTARRRDDKDSNPGPLSGVF